MTTLNPTQAALIGMLYESTLTGGDLVISSQRWLGPYWSMTRSQVYRELPMLVDKGYLSDAGTGPRNSQYYKVAPAGKRAFQKWLRETPRRDVMRSEVALRIAFGHLHKEGGLKDLIANAIKMHEEQEEVAIALLAEAQESGLDNDIIALDFAVRYHGMCIRWLQSIEMG